MWLAERSWDPRRCRKWCLAAV